MIPAMIPVTSRAIKEIGYDASREEMFVRFLNNNIWAYSPVDQATYTQVRNADSVGRAFNNLIRGNYDERQVPA